MTNGLTPIKERAYAMSDTALQADPRFGRVEDLPVLSDQEASDKFRAIVFKMKGVTSHK